MAGPLTGTSFVGAKDSLGWCGAQLRWTLVQLWIIQERLRASPTSWLQTRRANVFLCYTEIAIIYLTVCDNGTKRKEIAIISVALAAAVIIGIVSLPVKSGQEQNSIAQLRQENEQLNSTNLELRNLLSNMTDNYHVSISSSENLQSQLDTMTNNYNSAISSNSNLQTQLQQKDARIQQLQQSQATMDNQLSQPMTVISNGQVHWHFTDSKGNKYDWYIPIQTYDANVMANEYASRFIPTMELQLPSGQTVKTYNYSGIVDFLIQHKEWSTVIDQLYNNAGSDDQFIYEVWHVVAELTTYNKDITNTNLLPYEVLTRGEGDCKDKAILIADMLRSSSHTANWDIHLVIMDSDSPSNPQKANHMIVAVNTGQTRYLIEGTTTPDVNGLDIWKSGVQGWNVPF